MKKLKMVKKDYSRSKTESRYLLLYWYNFFQTKIIVFYEKSKKLLFQNNPCKLARLLDIQLS